MQSEAICCWKTRLFALGLASCLAGCQIFPPEESISAPSSQLQETLGHEVEAFATYGGVGHYDKLGALMLTEDSLQFRIWNRQFGRYEPEGVKIPYKNIILVYGDNRDYFTQRLVVIEGERCDGCKGEGRSYDFWFWFDEARRNNAQRTLLSRLDRTDTTHLPSVEMRNARDRVVAVTRGNTVPVVKWGVSTRASQGAGIGVAPFAPFIQIGGYQLIPYAILFGGIGATIGTALGLAEELSDSEQARMARREMMAESKAVPIQTWLLDSVMASVLEQGATANAGENGHLFSRVDDLRKKYRPLFREAIDHVLEVSVTELRVITNDERRGQIPQDTKEVQELFFELEAYYRVLNLTQNVDHPEILAHVNYSCRSASHPATTWHVEDAKLFREELHRCVDQLSEKIVSDFLTRFPNPTSLRKQKD